MKYTLLLAMTAMISLAAQAETHNGFKNLISLQKNTNGGFNAICADLTYEEVTAEDLEDSNLCPKHSKEGDTLAEGHYVRVGGDGSACDQDIDTVKSDSSGNLESFILILCDSSGDLRVPMACNNDECVGEHNSYTSIVNVTAKNQYTWTRKSQSGGIVKADFAYDGAKDLFPAPVKNVSHGQML